MYLRNLRNLIWVYCNQILSHKRYLYRNQNFNQKECMWFTCTFLINILIIKNWLTINDVVMLLLFYDRIFFVCLDWYDIPKKKKVVERFPIRQFLYFSLCCIRKIIIIISEAIISEHLCLHNVCLFVFSTKYHNMGECHKWEKQQNFLNWRRLWMPQATSMQQVSVCVFSRKFLSNIILLFGCCFCLWFE